MRKRILLFIIPVIALLIMATALVLMPAFSTHAAGTTKPTHTISAPTATPHRGILPDWSFFA